MGSAHTLVILELEQNPPRVGNRPGASFASVVPSSADTRIEATSPIVANDALTTSFAIAMAS